jgi:MFS family permease
MESFGAKFPKIYSDSGFKGWFTSVLLLFAWFGSLCNAPISDNFGRKRSMIFGVIIFLVGSVIQAAAVNTAMIFVGRSITGFPIGMLTMVVPQYMAETSVPAIRGTLVVLQQLSITLGILVSYWLEYGTHYIGGTRCDPSTPYSGGTSAVPTFNPYRDAPNGCTGQSTASWRVPFALQIFPALVLGIGMLFYPESPRFWLMTGKEDQALAALSRIRRMQPTDQRLRNEFIAIKAEVLFEQALVAEKFHGWTGVRLWTAQYTALVSTWPNFRRLAIGCCIMFFQQ